MALREILAKFGFEYDKPKLKEVDKNVESVKDTVTGVLKVLAGAAFLNGIRNFIGGIEQLGSSLNDLSEQTGVSTDTIQLFQYSVGLAGGSAEEADAAIRKLSISMGKAAAGGQEQASAFDELKVKYKDASGAARSLDDVLPDLFEAFGKITDGGKKSRLAVDLFGKAGVKMLGALSQGMPGFEALKDEFDALGGGLSAEAIAAADEYGDSLFKLNFAFTSIKSLLGAELFPMLTELVGYFTDGVIWVRRLAKGTELTKGLMVSLGIAGAAALVALLAPFAPIIAAITTLTLLFDDLINFIEGNDSVIGAALNGIFGEGTAAKVRAGLNDIGKEVKGFFEDLLKHPKKFLDDLELLVKGTSTAVKKLLGINTYADEQGTAVTTDQKQEAVKQRAADEQDYTETFGSKKLTQIVANDYLLNKLGVVDYKTFGRRSSGYQNADEMKPPPTEAPPPEPPAAPIPVVMSDTGTARDDWFSHMADSFGRFMGITEAGVPSTAAVPAMAGTAPPVLNQTNTQHFHVTAGTPDEVKDAVEKGATNAVGNERRNAIAQLEGKGGN